MKGKMFLFEYHPEYQICDDPYIITFVCSKVKIVANTAVSGYRDIVLILKLYRNYRIVAA